MVLDDKEIERSRKDDVAAARSKVKRDAARSGVEKKGIQQESV
jgi:hypothetical protein